MRCDQIFGTGTQLADAAQQLRATAATSTWAVDLLADQRTPATSAGGLDADVARALSDPLAVGVALQRREVTGETVHAFGEMVTLLRRLDDEVGPGHLINTVAAHLAVVTSLLSGSAPAGDAFIGLGRVVAELSQLMGWLSFDLNEPERASRHLAVAHQAAVAAGDHALAAYALSWQGLVIGQVSPDDGLALVRTAHRRVGPDAPTSVLAWLSRVEAESSAGRGNGYDTERALDQLTNAAAQPRSERDPTWTYFIDDGQIAAYRGVCYVRLARGRDAVAALNQALAALPESFVRDRSLYLTYLSAAHLLERQPDAAARAGTEAFRLAVRTQSPRTIGRLNTIDRDLAPWQNIPEVEEFRDLLTAHRYG